MDVNPFEIFRTEEDRWSWDCYIRQCDLIQLTDTQRHEVKSSFEYLRSVLGEGFLRRADKQYNPLFFWYFRNAAPMARLSMVRFADALRACEQAGNYNRILRRIKKPKNLEHDLAEAISLVEVAEKFASSGFDVEFEPAVQVVDRRGTVKTKRPDLTIVDQENGQRIYVEVSRLRKSDDQNLRSRTYHVIWNVMHGAMWSDPEALRDVTKPKHVLPFAIIHRGMNDEELPDIVAQLQTLISRVQGGLEFDELIIPDTIEAAVASYDFHERGREWAAARRMREADLVQGPDILTDEVGRTKIKIREKLQQLPDHSPGILVLPASENLILFVYDIPGLIATLAEEVQQHAKLLALVMFHTFTDSGRDPFVTQNGMHTFSRKIRSDGSSEHSLIVRNTHFQIPVANETLNRLKAVFC